jgi:hypothetical protein
LITVLALKSQGQRKQIKLSQRSLCGLAGTQQMLDIIKYFFPSHT